MFRHQIRMFRSRLKTLIFFCITLYFIILFLESISNENIRERSDWQQFGSIFNRSYFMYSAYRDSYKGRNIVRLIAITPSADWDLRVSCTFYDKQSELVGVTNGVINHTLCTVRHFTYSAAFVLCDIETLADQLHRMSFVSLSFPSANGHLTFIKNYPNSLEIQQHFQEPEKHEFAVCVQPTFNYNAVLDFIEWVEFHLEMGVTLFTFYNISIGPQVSCVMKNVYGPNLMQVQEWTVPIKNGGELHIHGQIAQANDCVMRHRGVAKYLVMVDLDEFIVPDPYIAENYKQLIKGVQGDFPDNVTIAQFQFRNAFFTDDFLKRNGIKGSEDVTLNDLKLYRPFVRTKDLQPHRKRSKFITTPKLVIEPGVHSLDEAVEDAIEVEVPMEAAYLRHYRGCGDECFEGQTEVDSKSRYFAKLIVNNVREKYKLAKEICNL